MKSRRAYESGVHAYLAAQGLLGASPDEIRAAKRVYWNRRKLEFKKAKRRLQATFTILLDAGELTKIAEAARLHGMSRTRFLRLAAVAYADKRYLVQNASAITEIRLLLSLNYSALRELFDLEMLPFDAGADLLRRMEALEARVMEALIHPKLLTGDH